MNQQEFDARCIELRDERRKIINDIKTLRLKEGHEVKQLLLDFEQEKMKIVQEYRNDVYDVATNNKPRTSGFIAGISEAKNRRDKRLAEVDDKIRKAENDFYDRSQELRIELETKCHEFNLRKAEVVREYNVWLEAYRAAKAAEKGAVV